MWPRCRRKSCSRRSASRLLPCASSARCSGSECSRLPSTSPRARHSRRSGAPRAARSSSGSRPGTMREIDVCPLVELPPGTGRIVEVRPLLSVGVYNCDGELFALEDRCSHDDGPLCEGDWDEDECRVVCPRHGSHFDLRTGRPLSLPAFEPVATFPVRVDENGIVKVE